MVGVDCVAGLEGDLLLWSRRRHGEVGAGSSGNIHRRGCGCWDESGSLIVVGIGDFMLMNFKKRCRETLCSRLEAMRGTDQRKPWFDGDSENVGWCVCGGSRAM